MVDTASANAPARRRPFGMRPARPAFNNTSDPLAGSVGKSSEASGLAPPIAPGALPELAPPSA